MSKLTIDDIPKNPLYEKWIQKYPPVSIPQYSQVCDGYSCMWCGRCPHGDLWKCPEEDLEEYEAYLKTLEEFGRQHPSYLSEIEVEINIPETA